MRVISSSIAACREENPWSCRDSEAIPVPALVSPRLNKVAMVIALIGSLFYLSSSRSQCKCITSSEWYKIFGITATKTEFLTLVKTFTFKHGVSPVREQIHQPPTSGTIQVLPCKHRLPIVWAQRGVLSRGTVPEQSPCPQTSFIVRPTLRYSHWPWGGFRSKDKL